VSGGSAYAASGVSIEAGSRAVDLMRVAVESTYGPAVLQGLGAFGGLYDAAAVKAMPAPVLVASTDGVGTKVRLAAQAGRYGGIGHDIVNHCVNDILVQGARPLFFLDYIASGRLVPEQVAAVVGGMAEACRAAGCALLGGETAEMPGVYAPGEFDVVGTVVGIVNRPLSLPRRDLAAGDVVIGLRSSGPHTNGFSLIRRVFDGVPLEQVFPELGVPLADALLAPHRSYLALLAPILGRPNSPVKALIHLTGGAFLENIPRVLPEGLEAVIRLGSWPVPPLFELIRARGDIAPDEMHRVFNMGLGLLAVVARAEAESFRAALGEDTWLIGELKSGRRGVRLA
jgi:phosphoribosylformylglycinamidine cyclo-ligase